ncbi:hypothetical protein [Aestuariispira insulae]|uniref:Uncharacterized protein n=1 Tax=Aestuariispira insulae TaxID=1461337 RepID=A0A3D9HV54_9PROT|nr:hypothetical protein [Aestuariispira insulae]RED53393.1 hypothetical protein DFP90_101181 [Aestuariispira insulae]
MRNLVAVFTVIILTFASAGVTLAREAASYEQALNLAKELSEQDFNTATKETLRLKAVGLAHILNNFALNEAEVRAESKVAPPLAALSRPGEAPKPDILTQPAGETVALDQVPDAWFLGMMDAARRNMRDMIAELDQSSPQPERLRLLATMIYANLEKVSRPPAG